MWLSRGDGADRSEWAGPGAGLHAYLDRIEDVPHLQQMLLLLLERLPKLLDQVRQLLTQEWPDYAKFLAEDRSDTTAVRAAAIRAGWAMPREASVLLVDPSNPLAQEVLGRLDSSCLLIRRRAVHGAIVPDPIRPGRRARLATALAGSGAVVG